ncbi:hypothetical protein TNCV_3694491 [Trichonephila clavipes]|nr:hypothetical protein TNCV_3694491 [Trichonephila clavipes]
MALRDLVEPEFKQGNVVLQIRDYNGKSLILRDDGSIIGKIAKCDEPVCGMSFTYRVKSKGELRLPCGRPLLIGLGEERILSTLTLNDLLDRKRNRKENKNGPKPNNQRKKTPAQAPRPDISKARKVSPNLDYSKVVQNKIPREHVSPPRLQNQQLDRPLAKMPA